MLARRLGRVAFLAGFALMVGSALVGRIVQPALTEIGLDAYRASGFGIDALAFYMFVLGFPIGLCACLMGVVMIGEKRWSGAWLFGSLVIPGTAIVTVYPAILGKQPSPAYFGIGGMCILLLVTFVVWCWGVCRVRHVGRRRAAHDLQAIGYLCFALAAWNVCGFASVPSLALFPEKMLALGTREFATGHLKAVMALFVLGWLFTAMGFHQVMRGSVSGDARSSSTD